MPYTKVGRVDKRFKWTRNRMRLLAIQAQEKMVNRSFVKGKDTNDREYKKYSPAYAKYKASTGANVNPVNLTMTGRLNQSIRPVKVSRFYVHIAATGDPAVYGAFVNKDRPFLGFSPSVRKFVQKVFNAMVRQSLERSGF